MSWLDRPRFDLRPLPAYVTSVPGEDASISFFKYADTSVTVEDDAGREVGSVCGCIGAVVEVVVGEYCYAVRHQDLWAAVVESHIAAGLPVPPGTREVMDEVRDRKE